MRRILGEKGVKNDCGQKKIKKVMKKMLNSVNGK